jgi:hypothetical protein
VERVHEWPDPVLALDPVAARFAVASESAIDVVELHLSALD